MWEGIFFACYVLCYNRNVSSSLTLQHIMGRQLKKSINFMYPCKNKESLACPQLFDVLISLTLQRDAGDEFVLNKYYFISCQTEDRTD